jgi:hypothetical protein
LEQRVTDRGDMVYEMVSLRGEWRCRSMTINFEPMDGRQVLSKMAMQKGTNAYKKNKLGFGFGVFSFKD